MGNMKYLIAKKATIESFKGKQFSYGASSEETNLEDS